MKKNSVTLFFSSSSEKQRKTKDGRNSFNLVSLGRGARTINLKFHAISAEIKRKLYTKKSVRNFYGSCYNLYFSYILMYCFDVGVKRRPMSMLNLLLNIIFIIQKVEADFKFLITTLLF